jgi:hypothetical protein
MHDDLTDRAAAIGRDNGRAAATWVFDGNTSEETCRRLLAGIESCDPEILDAYRVPDLSGEYAGDYTEDDLAAELDLDRDSSSHAEDVDAASGAYLDAASEGFWDEVERIAREHLGDGKIAVPRDAGFPSPAVVAHLSGRHGDCRVSPATGAAS